LSRGNQTGYPEISFSIDKNTSSPSTICEYDKIFTADKKRVSNTLAKKVLKALTERRRGNIRYELDEGIMLDIDSYANGSEKIFMDITQPSKIPLCAVGVMIDMSSSMKGCRINAATDMAMILELFCRKLKIPKMIYGHYELGKVRIKNFIDFNDVANNATASKLCAAKAVQGCNHDGCALRYGLSKLSDRNEPQKIMFVISDGRPNGTNYGYNDMKAEIPQLKKYCKKHKIVLIPIAIGDDIENLKALYGSDILIDGRDLTKLPVAVSKLLLKSIRKMLQ